MARDVGHLKPIFEEEAGMKFKTFFIQREGSAYRVIAEGLKNGEHKKINGLFCSRTTDAKYIVKLSIEKAQVKSLINSLQSSTYNITKQFTINAPNKDI